MMIETCVGYDDDNHWFFILSTHYLIMYFSLFFISFDYWFILAHLFMYLIIYLSLVYMFVNCLFIVIFYFSFLKSLVNLCAC